MCKYIAYTGKGVILALDIEELESLLDVLRDSIEEYRDTKLEDILDSLERANIALQ